MLNALLHLTPIYWSRRRVIARRQNFFRCILDICASPPDAAAAIMGQSEYDTPALLDEAVLDAEKGVLIFCVPARFLNEDCRHTYSLWQIGDQLKIGLLLSNDLDQAPVLDLHREIGRLWHDVPYIVINKGDSTLYEWTFTVPRLYESWSEQERFVRGMSHCKQRVLRIIHDYVVLKHQA